MPQSQQFPPQPEAIKAVRHFVWRGVAESPRAGDIILVASELATNAVRHAQTPFIVAVHNEDVIRLEVSDYSTQPPVPDRSPVGEVHGLQLVDTLANRWGYELLPTGKVVWAEMAPDSGP